MLGFEVHMIRKTVCAAVGVMLFIGSARAQSADDKAKALIDKGLAFLKSQQKPDGSWQGQDEPPAITAIAAKAFAGAGQMSDPAVQKAYDALLAQQKPDGGIYQDINANYNTAIAISALAATNDDKYKPAIGKAVKFLRTLQWNEEPSDSKERKPVGPSDNRFGGFGYGHSQRPDMSNTQVALDALHDAGVSPSDPAYQAALKFASRTQNLSETNDQEWAGNDGGFVYTPAGNGDSVAGAIVGPDGKRILRSYGSMTYAGLKSFIYAGLTKEDPRVKAAWEWITKNWTLDQNPGLQANDPKMAQNGLYYYFHTMARALATYDQPVVNDPKGTAHDWRVEFIDKVAQLQRADGSWAGEKRWMEDNPVLVTSYIVNALEDVREDLKEHQAK
jgi:squalene-hopene/tetraprenyl-beta-curcumene cyclase